MSHKEILPPCESSSTCFLKLSGGILHSCCAWAGVIIKGLYDEHLLQISSSVWEIPWEHTHSASALAMTTLPVQSEIGWNSAHIVGFSMGGMIACKFASLWPSRVDSLTLISSTRGNWDTLPRSWRAWKYLLKLASDKSATTRASVDLKFHFTKKSLKAYAHLCLFLISTGSWLV